MNGLINMNRFHLIACAVGALLSCNAAELPATNAPSQVAFIAIGDVPPKLVEHAKAWAEENLALRVDLLPPEKKSGKSLDDIAAQAEKAGGTNRTHVVAVAMPPEGINSHGMRTSDKHAAVVNLRPMQADKPDENILERRIERQTLRAIALLLDVETCPNPQCALAHYANLAELDMTGRNLCPPCLQKLQRNAIAGHMEMNKKSPFFMER
jgi:hypothetical protein